MEIILEILFELIVEGSFGAVGDKKVPVPIRILAAVFLVLLFGAVVGALVYIGISEGNWIAIAAGITLSLIAVFAIWRTVSKHRDR
ncbi:MAG: hypothetical protein J6X66_00715 [Lachnospiraceae bacterium]|nr:hypothetical protein [Lachnospiraceae bacterium]